MWTVKLSRPLLVSALALFCLGCKTVNESTLVGTYESSCPCVTITLVIKADHSFVQTARANSGETVQIMGKWRLDEPGRKDTALDRLIHRWVAFEPFLYLNDKGHLETSPRDYQQAETIGFLIQIGSPLYITCPDGTRHQADYNPK